MRNKIAWRISCCVCIALILITIIAPTIVCIGAYLEVENDPENNPEGGKQLGFFAIFVVMFWLLILPCELYLWYCCWYCFSPSEWYRSKLATMFMWGALILTTFCLFLISDGFIPIVNIPERTFEILLLSDVAAILVCQISAWISNGVAKRKLHKKGISVW